MTESRDDGSHSSLPKFSHSWLNTRLTSNVEIADQASADWPESWIEEMPTLQTPISLSVQANRCFLQAELKGPLSHWTKMTLSPITCNTVIDPAVIKVHRPTVRTETLTTSSKSAPLPTLLPGFPALGPEPFPFTSLNKVFCFILPY